MVFVGEKSNGGKKHQKTKALLAQPLRRHAPLWLRSIRFFPALPEGSANQSTGSGVNCKR